MESDDRQRTAEESGLLNEMRQRLGRARGILTRISDRQDGDPRSDVFRCLHGANARLGEALGHLSRTTDEMEREVGAEVESTDSLASELTGVRRILAEVADLAEKAYHTGAVDIVDDVGEAASLVDRATKHLMRPPE